MNIVFKALNDGTRREILELLRKKDMTAGEIAQQFDMSWPSISHHLDLLRQAGLVSAKKSGQFVIELYHFRSFSGHLYAIIYLGNGYYFTNCFNVKLVFR